MAVAGKGVNCDVSPQSNLSPKKKMQCHCNGKPLSLVLANSLSQSDFRNSVEHLQRSLATNLSV